MSCEKTELEIEKPPELPLRTCRFCGGTWRTLKHYCPRSDCGQALGSLGGSRRAF